jgi:hypothetical protein
MKEMLMLMHAGEEGIEGEGVNVERDEKGRRETKRTGV